MILIIKNIPFALTLPEFRKFIDKEFQHCSSLAARCIKQSELMVLFDKQRGEFEFYGLIHFYSRMSGHVAMQKLNGTHFKDRPVTAREFVIRKSGGLAQQGSLWLAAKQDQRRVKNERLMVFSSYEHIEVSDIETVNDPYLEPVFCL